MELAIMNGTYRDAKLFHPAQFARKSEKGDLRAAPGGRVTRF